MGKLRMESLKEQLKAAYERMNNAYDEEDDELRQFLSNHDKEMGVKEKEKIDLEERCRTLKRQLADHQQRLRALQIKKGKMQQIIQDHSHKKQNLLSRLQTLCDEHNIEMNHNDPQLMANKVVETMKGFYTAKQEELRQFQRETDCRSGD